MIKLFACDLDDTLLNENHMSDDTVRESVKKIVLGGKFFAVATGRDCSMEELRYLGLAEEGMYNITMNGALIRDWNGSILNSHPIDRRIIEDCLNKFSEMLIYYSSPSRTYILADRTEEEKHRSKAFDISLGQEEERQEFERLMQRRNYYGASTEDVLNEPILKISCRFKEEPLVARMEAFLQQYAGHIFNAPYDAHGYEITKVHIHKGNGVKWLAETLGVSIDEVAVYGDSWNDLEMLSMFPYSYTTAEAIPQVKEIASQVLGSCADHSVPNHILKTLVER